MEIFTQEGGIILSRWGHYLAGVTWLGLLYYFNFVQVPSVAQLEAGSRADLVRNVVPRALWWFRYSAVLTVLTGLSILGFQGHLQGGAYFKTSPGISISTGILLALVMFANVWMVIWPRQRVVIASARRVAAGDAADPAAAQAGRRALLASRTNAVLSIPMLWFMGVTSHFAASFEVRPKGGDRALYWLVTLVLVAAVEVNGLRGGSGPEPATAYLETHRATLVAGFALWALFLVLWEVLF